MAGAKALGQLCVVWGNGGKGEKERKGQEDEVTEVPHELTDRCENFTLSKKGSDGRFWNLGVTCRH